MKNFDIVKKSRMLDRPTFLDYAENIFNDFIEFKGDRNFKDDKSIIGGIATINTIPVTIIGTQKGSNTEENIKYNFGSPNPEGYRKSLRLMQQAEKFNRPIINFINTSGAFCGIEAEERGQGEAIARNLLVMSQLKTPIISIIIGEGGSGGALALAVADEVWMLSNSMYSILSPEGFASILWKDVKRAPEAADIMKLSAKDLLELKVIEKIIEEKNKDYVYNTIKSSILTTLNQLNSIDKQLLIQNRYNRFRKFGI